MSCTRLTLAALLCLVALGTVPAQQPPTLREHVGVNRVLMDVRVVDRKGKVVPGLGVDDFEVRVDGRSVPVLSVDGVPGAGPDRAGPDDPTGPPAERSTTSAAQRGAVDAGSLTVLLFQRDLYPTRIVGLMKLVPHARRLVERLGPDDRMAILVYDSHLKMYADFTSDRERLLQVLDDQIVRLGPEPAIVPGPAPSLGAAISHDEARDAAHLETALLHVARALESMPGQKTVVLLGWGMGVLIDGVVIVRHDYGPAVQAFRNGRTAVYSIDITQADAHTLEGPLVALARDTGGLYMKGNTLPHLAIERVSQVLEGHYVIAFEGPEGRRGEHRVRIRLVGRKGTVLGRDSYTD